MLQSFDTLIEEYQLNTERGIFITIFILNNSVDVDDIQTVVEKSISLRNVQHHFTLWIKNLNEIYIWWTNQRKYLGISWHVLLFMYNVCVLFTKLRSCDPHAIIIGFLYCQHQSSNFFFAKYIIRQDICNFTPVWTKIYFSCIYTFRILSTR